MLQVIVTSRISNNNATAITIVPIQLHHASDREIKFASKNKNITTSMDSPEIKMFL